jgi:hypothetical protein
MTNCERRLVTVPSVTVPATSAAGEADGDVSWTRVDVRTKYRRAKALLQDALQEVAVLREQGNADERDMERLRTALSEYAPTMPAQNIFASCSAASPCFCKA